MKRYAFPFVAALGILLALPAAAQTAKISKKNLVIREWNTDAKSGSSSYKYLKNASSAIVKGYNAPSGPGTPSRSRTGAPRRSSRRNPGCRGPGG